MKAIPLRAGDWQPRAAQRVAVLVPCFNEEATIGKVVADFRAALPEAAIYVYDNNSADRTGEVARAAGALVRRERHQGKGNVVRRMFADVDADLYVLVDGDATYDAASAPTMIARLIEERLDMVVGARVDHEEAAYRRGHRTGNRLLAGFFALAFHATFSDILSGYRVFSRRFVKSFPVLSRGFEIETELCVHALELELPVAEVPDALLCPPARVGVEAQHLARWRANPTHHRRSLPLGAAAGFFLRARHCAGHRFRRPGGSDLRDLFRARHCAAHSDGNSLHRPDAVGLPLDRRGPRARHGDPRAPRGQADRLSGAGGAGRGVGAATGLREGCGGRAWNRRQVSGRRQVARACAHQ